MRRTTARWAGLGAGLVGLVTLGCILSGKAAAPQQGGLPMDWSHHHVIFSQPATSEQAARLAQDPRYWQQWARINAVREVRDEAASYAAVRNSSGGAWAENMGSGASSGALNYPAKYSFQLTKANCASATQPDYVVFGTGLAGSSSQASVVAYDNLYSGCTGTVPQTYWAYNTGGTVTTSPVISGDGTQVAFVETSGGFGILVLLKFQASATETVSAPMTLTPVANASYRNCTAPCMTEIFLEDSHGTQINDTTSSAFPDYTDDNLWVGGAIGWLHKISGVFRGNPAEVTTGGFPAQLNPSNPANLSSPVYDYASGNVYVGDYGGYLYRVTGAGAVTKSAQVDHGTGIEAAPVIDSTSEKIYVFSSSDGTTACTGSQPCTAVFTFPAGFATGSSGTKVTLGASSATPSPLYEGAFDSTYLNSGNATGNLYLCGNTGGPPIMYQVPISAGVPGTVVTGPVLSNATTGCSPVTDVSNPNATGGTTEWFYAGVQTQGLGNSCGTGGCAFNFLDTPWQASHAYTVGQEVLDTHFQVQVARTAGTSKATVPVWSTTLGATTTDNGVHWLNQGPQSAAHATWQASHTYALNTEIVDSNGNIQLVTTAGTSRTVAQGHPTWQTTINNVTADNTVRWRNVGALATNSLSAAGGTSGIIIDNTVGSGTLAGASQIYFSTQNNETCGTSGTGGCAVQASQSALQ